MRKLLQMGVEWILEADASPVSDVRRNWTESLAARYTAWRGEWLSSTPDNGQVQPQRLLPRSAGSRGNHFYRRWRPWILWFHGAD